MELKLSITSMVPPSRSSLPLHLKPQKLRKHVLFRKSRFSAMVLMYGLSETAQLPFMKMASLKDSSFLLSPTLSLLLSSKMMTVVISDSSQTELSNGLLLLLIQMKLLK
jgi:hypothetical protein